ncbi:Gmad2 immunoglobulin-like domain-containing protein [Terrabacter sp. BE26]|uniref:Gmad2 immunoglobulin-like domain-containing protein n=1 Tax=Terrabacter sp. BE26 TaxID=2898152 RepID=UPI0035BE9CFD
MNPVPTGSFRGAEDEPDGTPVKSGNSGIDRGLGPTEDRLRRALEQDARSVTPSHRLGAILADAHGESFSSVRGGSSGSPEGVESRHRRWLLPAAAAAAALLVAGTLWAVNRPPVQAPPVAATAPTATTPPATAPTPSGSPSSIPTQTAEPTSPPPTVPASASAVPPPATVPVSVPVYYLGPVASGAPVRLFREFVTTTAGAPATSQSRVLAALRLAMGTPPAGAPYRSAWNGVSPQSVLLGPGGITVRLSSGSASAEPLATEQLVWTVQAALGKTLPVRFTLADGGSQISPGHPVTSSYTRPTDPMAVLDQVAPIWVDEPARGSVVTAGAPLRVTGVASTFEATVEWELLRNGRRVDKGVTTAAQSAPARAPYAFSTKPVPAGSYVLRVFEGSAKDGSTVAEQRVPLTAR